VRSPLATKPPAAFLPGVYFGFSVAYMKLKITLLLFVSLGLLAGCSSSTEHAERIQHSRPDEVTAFFGENITYSKGHRLVANKPNGTYLEGYEPAQAQLAGKKLPLAHLFVTLSHPKKASHLLVSIDPGQRPEEKFLYGLDTPN
jgi:hypothetical protein